MKKTEREYFAFANEKREYASSKYFLSSYTAIKRHRLFFKMYGFTFIEGVLNNRNKVWGEENAGL